MKFTITETKTIEIEANLPAYRYRSGSYYRIDKDCCIKVDELEIQSFTNTLSSPWCGGAYDIEPQLFYKKFAETNEIELWTF